MTTTRNEKLKTYSSLAGAITLTAGALQGQIVYRDISPDFIVTDTTQFRLDMDLNGTIDFRFQTLDTTITAYSVPAQLALANCELPPASGIAGFVYQSYPFVDSLSLGDVIDAGSTWNPQYANYGAHLLGAYATGFGTFGEWLNATDKYMGGRFVINNQVHYGWVRLSVSATADTIIVKDLAYNQNPNLAITAGFTVGIDDNTANESIRVYAYEGVLFVTCAQPEIGSRVYIYNTLGQEVLTQEFSDTNLRIDLTGQPVGTYFVRVQQESGTFTSKVVIR